MLTPTDTASLVTRFSRVRRFTERITETLGPEDATVQSMPDASPTKWHLAHTTWFFETFLLSHVPGYRPAIRQYEQLFNSYYNSVGTPYPRALRGMITRPTLQEVRKYRHEVDESLGEALARGLLERSPQLADVLEIGLHHEQQHQELILSDIKHALSLNPIDPVFMTAANTTSQDHGDMPPSPAKDWIDFEAGLQEIGHAGPGFAYDNESPRHKTWLEAFRLKANPVTCSEYRAFIEDGGYERPELWLSEGWNLIKQEEWSCPLYWRQESDDGWTEFTLAGRRPIVDHSPVTHVSYFEADAYARWAGTRLPTEAEWEVAAAPQPIAGNFVDHLLHSNQAVQPAANANDAGPLYRLYGDVWEWTSSSYAPYPGYKPPAGALGEYNGKFMCNQYVLRGGSCASSSDHLRPTYRNFFPSSARWQFAGIRLAE